MCQVWQESSCNSYWSRLHRHRQVCIQCWCTSLFREHGRKIFQGRQVHGAILEKPELFKCIFYRYHLLSYSYCNPWAFKGAYHNLIEKVYEDVEALLSALGKPECYQTVLDDVRLTSVCDLSALSSEELNNLLESLAGKCRQHGVSLLTTCQQGAKRLEICVR